MQHPSPTAQQLAVEAPYTTWRTGALMFGTPGFTTGQSFTARPCLGGDVLRCCSRLIQRSTSAVVVHLCSTFGGAHARSRGLPNLRSWTRYHPAQASAVACSTSSSATSIPCTIQNPNNPDVSLSTHPQCHLCHSLLQLLPAGRTPCLPALSSHLGSACPRCRLHPFRATCKSRTHCNKPSPTSSSR